MEVSLLILIEKKYKPERVKFSSFRGHKQQFRNLRQMT